MLTPFAIPESEFEILTMYRETRVRSLGWEDPLEKEMATHSNILAWEIPWMQEPGGLQSTGSQRVGHNWTTSLSLSLSIPYNILQGGMPDLRFKSVNKYHFILTYTVEVTIFQYSIGMILKLGKKKKKTLLFLFY